MADENVIGGVKVQIEADYSPLEKDFQEAVRLAVEAGSSLAEAMQKAMPILDATPVTQAFQSVDAAAQKTGVDLGQAGEQAKKAESIFEQFGNLLRSDSQGFQQFAQGVENFISHPLQFAGNAAKEFLLALGPIGGIALAGAAAMITLGKEAFNLVQEFGAAAEQTGNLADRLNLTWRETRNLEEMGKIAGVSIQSLGAASFRLAEAFDQDSKQGQKIAAALQSIGVTGSTSGELLRGFLDKLSKIPNETERIDLAHKVLGRSSAQILPLIKNFDELKKAIQEVGPAISDLQANDLQKADDAMDKLGLATSRFKEQIAAALAPAVMALVDNVRMLVVDISKLTVETIGTTKALAEMIPSSLLSTLQSIGEKFIWMQTHLNPFIATLRLARVALDEFNLVGATISHKTIPEMDAALREKIGKTIQQTTETTREYLNIWKNQGGGSKAMIEDIIAQHEKLSTRVRDSKAAYDTLAEAYRTGTPLADGYRVTSGDVATALSNLKAAEAAATTTKEVHDKATGHITKSFYTMGSAIRLLVEEQKLWHAEAEKSIDATARYNNAMRQMIAGFQDLTPIQLAAKHMEEFNRDLEKMEKDAPLLDLSPYSPIFLETAKDIDVITKSLNEMQQKMLDTSPEGKLAEALNTLGIKGKSYYEHQVDIAQQAYDAILESGTDDYSLLDRAAAELALRQARYALQAKEISIDAYDAIVKAVKKDLDELDGDANDSAGNRGHYERTLGQEIQDINRRTFDSLERGLAQAVVNFKGFSDLWKTLWHKLAEDVLGIMFKVLLNPLEKQIGSILGKIPGLGGGGGGGGAAGAAGSAGGATSAISSGIGGIANIVTGAITAISSVVGNFQMAHMSSDLQKVEESTRYLKIGLVTQNDSLLVTSHSMADTLSQILMSTKGLVGINLSGTITQDKANQLLDDLVNSSSNLYVTSARTLTEIRDSVRGGTELLLGQLFLISKALNPSIGKQLLNNFLGGGGILGAGAGGLGSIASSAASALTAPFNALASLFGGGASDIDKAIELNTRKGSLYLGERADGGILGVLFRVLDEVSFGAGVKAMEASRDILMDIRTILQSGAGSGKVPAFASAASSAGAAYAVHIDLSGANLSGDLTDTQVQNAFDRGFRRSKLAGAFPPGRFPS